MGITSPILIDVRLAIPFRVRDEFARRVDTFQKFLRQATGLFNHQRRTVILPQSDRIVNLVGFYRYVYESDDRHENLLLTTLIMFHISVCWTLTMICGTVCADG